MANEAYLVDLTDAAAWLPTVFVPATKGYWTEQLSIAQAATDYSGRYTGGAKAISIPLVPLTASTTKTSGTALVYGDLTDLTAATINLTTQKAQPFLVEDIVQMQTDVQMFQTFAQTAAERLAMDLDALLATTVQGETANTAITTGTDNTITYQNLLTAQATFNGQRIKVKNCVMGIAPGAFELSVIDWGDKYMSASYRNAAEPGFWYTGAEGRILGMQVFVDGNWTAGTTDECATIWHPTALGYASSGPLMVGPTPEPLYLGYGWTMHQVMGAVVVNAYGVLKIVND